MALVTASVLGTAFARPASAAELVSQGEVGFEGRAFRDDDDPRTEERGLALRARVETRFRHAPIEAKARVFGRQDAFDRRRQVLLVEEAWLSARLGRWRLRVGSDILNWTATEAFHPADVINARNLDSDVENFDKVGEPMVALQVGLFAATTLSAYYMPVYMATLFPTPASRLSFAPPGTDLEGRRRLVGRDGRFTDSDFGHQAALRIQQTIGAADVSLFALEHMDRLQPVAALDLAAAAPLVIFQTVRQLGATYQHALGPVLLKIEGAYRWFVAPADASVGAGLRPVAGTALFPARNHGALAAGVEYGLPHQNGSESTVIFEAQAIAGVPEEIRDTLSPFQRDVLVAYRFALNDEDSKEILVGSIFDLEDPRQVLVSVSYQQRLGETWSLRAGLRIFEARESSTPTGFAALRDADHVRLTLIRHF